MGRPAKYSAHDIEIVDLMKSNARPLDILKRFPLLKPDRMNYLRRAFKVPKFNPWITRTSREIELLKTVTELLKTTTKSQIAKKLHLSRQRIDQILNNHADRSRRLLYREIMAGRIVRPDNCEKCKSKTFTEAHHNNYDEPLNVEWLCKRCHVSKHTRTASSMKKPKTSISISNHAIALLKELQKHLGINRSSVIEIIVREKWESIFKK